ncbi:MAG TPA: hypothetical protein VHE55_16880 [Fimbriimonadaceae bacterium]|nr:hypothetical protein [Fimbriimonadaceae bacterium]
MQPKQKSLLGWILGGIGAFFVCACGVGGFLGWRVFNRLTTPIPAHDGFENGIENHPLGDGWYALTLKEMGFSIEAPATLTPYRRTIGRFRQPWISSYESFHGKSREGAIVIGGLWIDRTRSRHTPRSEAEAGLTQLRENPEYSRVKGEIHDETLAGIPVVSALYSFHGTSDGEEHALYFFNGDCLIYVLESYRKEHKSVGDQMWSRMTSSLKLLPAR